MSRQRENILESEWWIITLAYLIMFVTLLAVFGLLSIFWGEYALFSLQDLWVSDPDILAGISKVWFIFVWGGAFTFIVGILLVGTPRTLSPGFVLGNGLWLSLNAGVFEELLYRWLRFSIAMIILPFLNLITFGILEWVYTVVLVPLANWATFGALSEYLFHPASWVIGAAIVSANGSFRDGHKKNGFIGWVNSWFIGMVFFYLMFNYGLQTAIVAHVLYDVVIFVIVALITSWQPVAQSRLWNYSPPRRTVRNY